MKEQWETNWKDYYEVLGVSNTASENEIKSAYRYLAAKYNIDASYGISDEEKEYAHKMLVDINEAYTVLSNEDKREKYDEAYIEKIGLKGTLATIEDMSGTLDKPLDNKALKYGARTLLIGGTIVGLCTAFYYLGKGSDKINIDYPELPSDPAIEEPTINPTEKPIIIDDKEVVTTPEPTVLPTATPTHTTKPESTVESTVTPEPTPVAEDTEIIAATDKVAANWQSHGVNYDKETIVEIIKCLNGMSSTMSIDEVDEILSDIVSRTMTPGINNAIAGEKAYATSKLDLSSLLVTDKSGYTAVRSMELNLNGALVDTANLVIYGERAFVDEALILGEGELTDGIGINSGSPAARILWGRLTIGMNGIAGILGDDLSVVVNDKVYTQDDLNNSSVLENMITSAKQELGSNTKSMN